MRLTQKSTVSASADFIVEFGEQCQRVAGDGTVVMRAPDRILERSVLAHQADCMLEVGVGCFAAFQRAAPEFTFAIAAAAEGQYDR